MYSTANRSRMISLALTTALAGAVVTGCTTQAAPPAAVSASKAEAALASGKHDVAVANAERAVLADPRNPAYRAMLGAAYLDAGRFASAATAYADAVELGDSSPRTALSLALALSATGKGSQAVMVLEKSEARIADSDLGLAYTLAGAPERGVHILANALRGGENNAKVRQNLAYSFAMAGRWREARLMAAEDIPGDKVGDRMAEWAQVSQPGYEPWRVAKLLQVPLSVEDEGQPAQLALANFPTAVELANHAIEQAPPAPAAPRVAAAPQPTAAVPVAAEDHMELASIEVPQSVPELAPLAVPAAAPAPAPEPGAAPARATFTQAFPSPAPVAQDTQRFVREAVAESRPTARVGGAKPVIARAPAASAPVANGAHLVQLGSFSSEASAKRAWGIYTKRYPELASHELVISEAIVRGKRYWRVSAAGYDASSSRAMCGRVKRTGEGCFAYHESRPLPGAIDTGVRLARR